MKWLVGNSVVRAVLLVAAAAMFSLHFVHLTADFPNFSEWMDWAKYTDEGWYGDAAIRHYLLGHWNVPGDFNPAAALPVWPLLEALLFRFTGVSLIAARALSVGVFGATIVAGWLLLRRWSEPGALAPAVAALLLAINPLCFVITRMAILEPLLILLTLCAMLVASRARAVSRDARPAPSGLGAWRTGWRQEIRGNAWVVVGVGLLVPAMVLCKTTGLFLLPAVLYLLWAAMGFRLRAALQVAVPALLLAAAVWGGYFTLLVRPRYLLDYRYLFAANAYTGITLDTAGQVLHDTVLDGNWMGGALYLTALGCVALALVSPLLARNRTRHPAVVALVLWALGYAAFLAYHDNLQPRYYLVVTVPLILLVPLALEQLVVLRLREAGPRWFLARRVAVGLIAAGLLLIAIPQARETIRYTEHAQYTLVTAAREVHDYIQNDRKTDPSHSRLVLSISGSDLSLMTGLPSICDDFGTLELVDRVRLYRPGWYAAWNDIEDDKMEALTPFFHVERVAEFPAMDDPDRNVLILYKLEAGGEGTPRTRKEKPTPKRLRTKVGEQPSTTQLQH